MADMSLTATQPRASWALRVAASGWVLASACSAVVNSGRLQCREDVDCARGGSDGATLECRSGLCQVRVIEGPFDCAGDLPAPQINVPGPRAFSLTVIDAASGDPLAGVEAKPCGSTDPNCVAPLATTVRSDEAGRVSFSDLFTERSIFVELRATEHLSALVFVDRYQEAAGAVTPPIGVFTAEELRRRLAAVGDVDDGLGQLWLQLHACPEQQPKGASLSIDRFSDDTRRFFVAGESGLGRPTGSTDDAGIAGVLNAPSPALIEISLLDASSMVRGTTRLLTRSGWITYAPLRPFSRE